MANHKQGLTNYWGWFHIGFIILVCSYSTYHKYCRFYNVPENQAIKKTNMALFTGNVLTYYSRLSGTGAGYGFFAPQIKSTGLIIGDCDGNRIGARFKNFETMMRFNVMAGRVTDYLITKDDGSPITDSVLKSKFYDLVFKSIAVKVYNQNQCSQDTLHLSYNIVNFPTLRQYRAGRRNYQLITTKEVSIVKTAE